MFHGVAVTVTLCIPQYLWRARLELEKRAHHDKDPVLWDPFFRVFELL